MATTTRFGALFALPLAAGAAGAPAAALRADATDDDGAESLRVTLNINGQPRALRLDPRTTLLDALRDQAGMPRPGPDAELMERHLRPARASVPPRQWDDHWQAGRVRTALEALRDEGVIP